jgi:hypothetical protein
MARSSIEVRVHREVNFVPALAFLRIIGYDLRVIKHLEPIAN